jgi:hypothetical protein
MSAASPTPPAAPPPAPEFDALAIQVAELRGRFEERTAAMQRQLDRLDSRLWWIIALIVGQILVPLLARRWGL